MFLLGAYAGILVFALVSIAAREYAQGVKEEEVVGSDGLGPIKLDEEWSRGVANEVRVTDRETGCP